jgi:site-specific recombinase XerD
MNSILEQLFREIPKHINSEYVFYREDGSKLLASTIRKPFEQALKRAGIKGASFHTLRHTFASYLVMSGVDIRTVQELLGHKSLEMTMKYAHLSGSHKRAAVEQLAAYIRQKGKRDAEYLQNCHGTSGGIGLCTL